jgi:hypothetical protein
LPQQNQIVKPKTLNLDAAKKYLKETEAAYLLNYDYNNPSSVEKGVPLLANIPLCEMELPSGETHSIGTYSCELTNEIYSFEFNTNGIHFITRVNGDGICEVVYSNTDTNRCLNLSANPKHAITEWRAYIHLEKSNCENRHGVYLIWTDGLNDIGCIDVNASIATNSFSTPFFDNCMTGCEPLILCVPQPFSCINAEYLPIESQDVLLPNFLPESVMFSYRWIYYDRRASVWADPSKLYTQVVANCFSNKKESSRCMNIRIPAGNPLVEKIELAFTEDGRIWKLTDTIEKYKKYNGSQEKWYERGLSEDIIIGDDCAFDYLFCNDKKCQNVSLDELSKVYIPTPQQAQGLLPIAEGSAHTLARLS